MLGLGPYPYRPKQGLTEDRYNRAWNNQKVTIKNALVKAGKYDRIGKRSWAKDYYSGTAYIYFIMHYANLIVQRVDFLASVGEDFSVQQIKEQYKVQCILNSLPCISNCKGVNLRLAFEQIFKDFGISILLTEEEIPFCPGISKMVIGSILDDAFTIGGTGCVVNSQGSYDENEYDNNEYETN